ncbi:lipoprotein insertase outer membrane protein LolB [Neptuniibacter sp. PT8_73]|uniref:lipoprotein insertase outer membrane protein LolB n=1 Tax=Neptuniibacter sp. PT8_73 TaxID=3398206 RepID=UPI0039F5F03F
MLKRYLGALLCLFLAGCSLQKTQLPAPNDISWETRQSLLKDISDWEASGKIGIRTPEDSQSASLKWLQEGSDYQIDIRGPWGQGGASIAGNPQEVIVDIAGEGTFTGTNPEQILHQQWGWALPVSDIFWWIRGLPSPHSQYDQTVVDERLAQLTQQDWKIEYLRYNQQTPALPTKMRLQFRDLKVTIVIKTWIKL